MKKILILLVLAHISTFGQSDFEIAINKSLDTLIKHPRDMNYPGGAILVIQNGKTIYKNEFGYADFKTKTPFTLNTISNTGSITKTLVAYGILILAEQGKLSLDDNLLKFFPDFTNKEIAKKITLKHFLTHTSGIPDLRTVEKDSIFYLTAKDMENFAPLKNVKKLNFDLGSQWEYSNPAYNGLALIIEQVSGIKWQKFLENSILKPSKMRRSEFTDGSFPSEGVAHGYCLSKGKFEECDYGEIPTFCAAGNGGFWSSINDFVKYYYALKNYSFCKKETIDLSCKLWYPEGWKNSKPPSNGFSWFIYEAKNYKTLKYDIIEHTGSQGGFRGSFSMIPEKDTQIYMLFNDSMPFVKPFRKNIYSALGYAN